MISKTIKIFIGAVLISFVLLPDVQPLVANNVPIFEATKWSSRDVWKMARTDTMATAVSLLTNAEHGTGAPGIQLEEMKDKIDGHTAADTRKAILKVADASHKKKSKKNKKISDFANTANPAAVCATTDTAGEHGLDACVSECESKRFRRVKTRQKAACHVLCTLAAAPCDKQPFSLGTTTAIDLRASAIKWVATAPGKIRIEATKLEAAMSNKEKGIFLLFVFLAGRVYFTVKTRTALKHAEEAEKRLEAERLAMGKLKARHVLEARARWLKQRALYALHDHFVHSAYRDSREAKDKEASCRLLEGLAARRRRRMMAARLVQWQRAAKVVKAVAVQVAMDEVLLEQFNVKGQGVAGCIVS